MCPISLASVGEACLGNAVAQGCVIRRLAEQLGVHHEALTSWVRQAEADAGERTDRTTSEMAEENRRLRREVAELRRANEIPKAASAYFAAELCAM
ncbi:transposase [Micromonospora sp. AMSO31t]|uniref:transposase n=1 Tax=Micromonospora sp. AMSO31t TaxID=2650566 RepID=UPI001CED8BA1|nr:transposase [Micromonospora sp. AMSO31t]